MHFVLMKNILGIKETGCNICILFPEVNVTGES